MTTRRPVPLAKKLTLQERLNYPTIRHLTWEQAQTFHERLIVGEKTTAGRLSEEYFRKGREYEFIDPDGKIGSLATVDFGEIVPEISERIFDKLNLSSDLRKQLLSGKGILIDGLGTIYQNHGLATKLIERIEIVARKRGLKFLLLISRNPITSKICESKKWKKFITPKDTYYIKLL